MDFFASQELARRNTRKLIILLALTVLCITLAIYGLIVGVFVYADRNYNQLLQQDPMAWFTSLQNLELFGGVLTGVSAVVGFGSMYKISELNAGGKVVAEMLGGRRLAPDSSDLTERRLLNIVEEMALASGVAVPPVYVLDRELGINAFAAGHTIDDCVIGVNRGTLEQLNRDELQGVIAHEFSHILNGDMRMSLRMIGLLHGILVIALVGYQLIRVIGNSSSRSSSDDRKDNGGAAAALFVVGAGLVVIGGIGLFFSKLIKASISRQREYLADASAVQFTRNPEGIAGALKMIGAAQQSSRVQSENAETISHMFFANMFGSRFGGLFSTHPPLIPRIQRVDRQFQGDFNEYLKSRSTASVLDDRREEKKEQRRSPLEKFGFPGMGMPGMNLPGGAAAGGMLNPAVLVSAVGEPTDEDVVYSRVLVGKIPNALQTAIRDVFLARCVVFAWLLDEQAEIREQQLAIIGQYSNAETVRQTAAYQALIQQVDVPYRLPISEILQGTLVGMSEKQYRTFRATVVALIKADREIDLFEFFIQNHLVGHLDRHFGVGLPHRTIYESLDKLESECATLLSVLAEFGHEDESSAAEAFAAAWKTLSPLFGPREYSSAGWDYPKLANAVKRLSHAAPNARKQILAAAAVSISHDEAVSAVEAELYRALGESLDCPIPPLLPTEARVRG
ncbi:MAG: M48 family metallopeptidase [Planctomycetota bacterium]